MSAPLFPAYLNKGSSGPPVAVLQLILKAAGFDPEDQIIVDGEYGDMTAKAVEQLQKEYGLEVNGHFGPETSEAVRDRLWIDVNSIPADVFEGETQTVSPS